MVEHVLDIERIKQLKYRYVRTLDTKDWDEFEECLTEDATGDYAGLTFANRADLVAYMRENLPAGILTMHQVHHPEITFDDASPDIARGRWYLQDKVVSDAFRFALEGAAFYEDRYVRTPAGWRIAHTGYVRTFEMTWSLDDLPSLKVESPAGAARSSER